MRTVSWSAVFLSSGGASVSGSEKKWNGKTLMIVLVASIIPFGTFYVDRVYLKNN
ncbi:MAG: DUF3817 domain-containing protein [Psychroserpens sp.]|nr:DUF3817 domain-containing protein [Psychroserpens sp.]